MPTLKEIHAYLEELAPPALAEDWDNVGLLVDTGAEVTSALLALDITGPVLDEAAACDCSLVISHHPVIFHPLRTLTAADVPFRMARMGVSGICMHTNMDAAVGGVNDVLADRLGLREVTAFGGLGRVGSLPSPLSLPDLAALCAERLDARVKYADPGVTVARLAVVGGAGGDLLAAAKAAGADALLTGEAHHHEALEALRTGTGLLAAGHFATEFPLMPALADKLRARFPGLRVLVSRRDRDPFTYL